MKPSQWIDEIKSNLKFKDFNDKEFVKSCLIYGKGNYGIFLLEKENKEKYTAKVFSEFGSNQNTEIFISLYVKEFASHIPNLLHVEDILKGRTPLMYSLFDKRENNIDRLCKDIDINKHFILDRYPYLYYLTKACSYNLAYYMGVGKGTFSYQGFVNLTFSLLVGMQTLHRLGIWHRDLKPANILLCKSSKSKISYLYDVKNEEDDEKGKDMKNKKNRIWTLSYKDTDNHELKIIDYGESVVVDEVFAPCSIFTSEVNIAIVSIIKQIWNKSEKKNVDLYEDLISRLEKCSTSVLDVMLNSPIFSSLLSSKAEEYVVDLLV